MEFLAQVREKYNHQQLPEAQTFLKQINDDPIMNFMQASRDALEVGDVQELRQVLPGAFPIHNTALGLDLSEGMANTLTFYKALEEACQKQGITVQSALEQRFKDKTLIKERLELVQSLRQSLAL